MKMTKIECLEKCLIDWLNIWENDCGKMQLPLSAYGVDQRPLYDCFCCSYTHTRVSGTPFDNNNLHDPYCSLCPLSGYAWPAGDHCVVKKGMGDSWFSYYAMWTSALNYYPNDKKIAAFQMVGAIREALSYEYLREMNK